jgi:hypothetical protein
VNPNPTVHNAGGDAAGSGGFRKAARASDDQKRCIIDKVPRVIPRIAA